MIILIKKILARLNLVKLVWLEDDDKRCYLRIIRRTPLGEQLISFNGIYYTFDMDSGKVYYGINRQYSKRVVKFKGHNE